MTTAKTSAERRQRTRGQSLVEFALVLPLVVGIFGAVGDVARVYQSWITLQGATRSAAEMAATEALTVDGARTLAAAAVCSEMSGVAGFSGTATSCSNPSVSITAFTRTSDAPGASTKYPLTTVTVATQFDFRPLFAYPLLTNAGTWTVETEASYSILQRR